MPKRMLLAIVIAATTAVMATGTAGAVTPLNGGPAGGTTIAINSGPGDQTEPHVSGDLAVYTDNSTNNSSIHYYDFPTGGDRLVPTAVGESDALSDVSGSRIAFSRTHLDGTTGLMLFDVASRGLRELDPHPGSVRFGAALGGDTVAFADFAGAAGRGEIDAYDLATGTLTALDQSIQLGSVPNVAPAGDVVVWDRCAGVLASGFPDCDIYQSVRSSGVWATPTLVAGGPSTETNPDTDGTTVVYDSDRSSPTGKDIYLKPVAGGPEVPLQLAGVQQDPRISHGVIAFQSAAAQPEPSDIYVYVVATNTLLRVTDTPTVNESLNGVTVLPNGDIRVVWAADDDVGSLHNIYARTFTPPAVDSTPPAITYTVSGTKGDNGWYTSDVDLTWHVTEPESFVSLVKTGCVDQSITADQPATTYSCAASSAGGSAAPVDVTIKRDATSPTVSFSGNAGSYTVAQTVTIACSATDNLSGIATGCTSLNLPAYRFHLGPNTITRTATDNAGNTGMASTSFTVVLDPASLCYLTTQFVQSSAAYRALNPPAQRRVDASLSAACAILTRLGRTLSPTEKATFIKAYKDAIKLLASAGWLTSSQTTTLATLADGL